MLTDNPARSFEIDDWVKAFDSVYGNVNSERSIIEIWMHAVEHGSQLHEHIRVDDYEEALMHIADLFCWVCALITKAKKEYKTPNSLTEIILSKYPRICFYCGEMNCDCQRMFGRGIEDPRKKKTLRTEALLRVKIKKIKLLDAGEEPKTLEELVSMYYDIFDHVNYRAKIQEIMAHLQEEIGEVSSCLNDFENDEELKQDADRLFEFQHEIADVVTWIVAITLKIDYLLAAGANYLSRNNLVKDNKNLESALGKRSVGLSLPTIIWDVYKDPNDKLLWCPSCGKEICDQSNEKKNSIELDN